MYVRWKRHLQVYSVGEPPDFGVNPDAWLRYCTRLRRKEKRVPRYRLDAVLVESVRVDGKVRQRFIKHLASIWEGQLNPHRVNSFWRDALGKLGEAGLTPEMMARAEAVLASRVPRLTEEQAAVVRAETAAILSRFRHVDTQLSAT